MLPMSPDRTKPPSNPRLQRPAVAGELTGGDRVVLRASAAAAELPSRSAAEGHDAEIVFGILTNDPTKGAYNADQHRPVSPRTACDAREDLSGISQRGRDGQMASAERVHGQGSPSGR